MNSGDLQAEQEKLMQTEGRHVQSSAIRAQGSLSGFLYANAQRHASFLFPQRQQHTHTTRTLPLLK